MQDRRKSFRMRVLKGAKIALNKNSVLDCTVRNLSNLGAVFDIPNTIDLPEKLDVSVEKRDLFRQSRLVWRKLNKAGIEFL